MKIEPPEVRQNSWIKIGSDRPYQGLDGYVLRIYEPGKLSVGYLQNELKAIRTDIIWNGNYWEFAPPDYGLGSYLSGYEEAIVKRGPPA